MIKQKMLTDGLTDNHYRKNRRSKGKINISLRPSSYTGDWVYTLIRSHTVPVRLYLQLFATFSRSEKKSKIIPIEDFTNSATANWFCKPWWCWINCTVIRNYTFCFCFLFFWKFHRWEICCHIVKHSHHYLEIYQFLSSFTASLYISMDRSIHR